MRRLSLSGPVLLLAMAGSPLCVFAAQTPCAAEILTLPAGPLSAANPACRTSARAQHFVLGRLGTWYQDRAGLRSALRAYHDLQPQSRLSTTLHALDVTLEAGQIPGDSEVAAARTATSQFIEALSALPNQPMALQLDESATAGSSDAHHAVTAFVQRRYVGGALLTITAHDQQVLQTVLQQLDSLLDQARAGVPLDTLELPDPSPTLTSSFQLQGAIVSEQGLSYGSSRVSDQETWSWGVALKAMRFQGVVFETTVQDARRSQFNLATHSHSWTFPDADAGIAWQESHWSAGLMVENLFAHHFVLPSGQALTLGTVWRASLAYASGHWQFASLPDLNTPQPCSGPVCRRDWRTGVRYTAVAQLGVHAGLQVNLSDGDVLPTLGLDWLGRRWQGQAMLARRGREYAAELVLGLRF